MTMDAWQLIGSHISAFGAGMSLAFAICTVWR